MTIWNKPNCRGRAWGAPRCCCALTALVLATAPLLSLADEPAAAAAPTAGVRSQDQVWLVSTRHIGCPDGGAPAYWQLSGGQWAGRSADDFHKSADPDVPTVIYIHGNRIDNQEGSSGGLAVYHAVVSGHADEQGVRYVIWSWPSTKICGPIKDVRSKAWRSDDESILLARFLAEFQPPPAAGAESSGPENKPQRVGIVAFSYGARITGGALHLLAGGELCGQTVAAGERPQFRVAFWAAAAHNNWLYPGCRHGQALPLGEKWLNLVNGRDESLTHYEMLERGHNPPALGYTGLAGRYQLSAELSDRWEEWQVSNLVSRTHNYHPYVHSPWVTERTAEVVLWKE